MKHWAVEFQPRSLCSFDGGPDGGPGGDSGGPPSGDTGGDFFGSNDGGYYGTNDSGSFFGGDTAPASPTGGDSWTGSESGAGTFAASNSGGYFGGDTSSSGGGFIGGPEGGGGGEGGFIGPNSDFGYAPGDGWGPSGGVDFAGSSMGFGPAGAGNLGFGNAIGPAGWATGDFGLQGYGGPTGTGAGPGSTASIGGPQAYAQSPGINGFPGDFGAPPGGAFGMPGQGDVGPQAGPGMPGGPGTVGNAEPTGILSPAQETTPDVPLPDDRTEADPTAVFGPAYATNQAAPTAGWFGPSQAQAADRGTDQGIINAAMFANDFGKTGPDMSAYIAATNPGLAQALGTIATNFQADPANDPANYAGPSPGAQQGFQGVSNAQNSPNAFTSFAGPTTDTRPDADTRQAGYDMLAQQMNEQQSNQNAQQSTQMMDAQALGEQGRGPQDADARTAGYQQLADQMNAQNARQAGYDQLAQQMQAQNEQQAMIAGQEKGEQGKAGIFGVPSVDPATAKSGYDQLAQQMNARQDATPQQIQQGYQTLADQMNQQNMVTAKEEGDQQGRGEPLAPWATPSQQTETIGLTRGDDGRINQDVISALNPATLGAGGGIGVPGLLSMYGGGSTQADPSGRPGGSPTGNPTQAGVGPFGPSGRPGDESGRPGLAITVGNNQYAAGRPGGPGYYQTGGAGIAPGAKGAEYGGVYGRGDAYSTGRPGTNSFGAGGPGSWGAAAAAAARAGGGGGYFYDPATGQYYQTSRR